MYKLYFIAPDNEYVIEGEYTTIEEAIYNWQNIGSRWIFYPFGVITTQKGFIVLTHELLQDKYYRKNIKTLLRDNIVQYYIT